MKLYLSTTDSPWYYAAKWDRTDTTNIGAVEEIDPEGCRNWSSCILHALADAALAYEDEAGELPAEIELHLSSIQAAGAGDILRKLRDGAWPTQNEARLANLLLAKGIVIRVRPSTRADMAIVREARELVGRSKAVEFMAGMGVL